MDTKFIITCFIVLMGAIKFVSPCDTNFITFLFRQLVGKGTVWVWSGCRNGAIRVVSCDRISGYFYSTNFRKLANGKFQTCHCLP